MSYHALKEPIINMENDVREHVRGKKVAGVLGQPSRDLTMARVIFSAREHFLDRKVLLSTGEVVRV